MKPLVLPFLLVLSAVLSPSHTHGEDRIKSRATPSQPVRTDRYGDPLPTGAIARLGTVRLRAGDEVHSVVFTPDGKFVILSDAGAQFHGPDRFIGVYDATTGARVRAFPGHRLNVLARLAVSPDGKTLAEIGGAHSVCLWDLETGRLLHEFGGDDVTNLVGIAFAPDSKTVTTIGGGSGIQIWDCATGERLRRLAGEKSGSSLAYSPDGKLLAAAGVESLQLSDVAGDRVLWQVKAAMGGNDAVAFSPDAKMIAVGDATGAILVVVTADGKELCRWQAHAAFDAHQRATETLAFSPDGNTLASGGDDGLIYLWDPLTGKKAGTLRGHLGAVYSVAFSRDGRTLASGSLDKTARLWDVAARRERPAFNGHDGGVTCLAFAPDGRRLASGGRDKTVQLWDAERAEQQWVLPRHRDRLAAVACSADGKLLASADDSGDIRLLEAATGKPIHLLGAFADYLVAFQPDGKTLASAGAGPAVRVWDIASGKERPRVPIVGKSKWKGALGFSPDGKLIAWRAEDSTIHLLDWAAGRELCCLAAKKSNIWRIAFAPDGRRVVTGGDDGIIRIWRVSDGEELFLWPTRARSVDALAFSGDGRFLASGGWHESGVMLWDAATGKEIHRFEGHRARIDALAFSPVGLRLASGSSDFTALVWDVPAALGRDAPPASDPERCWSDLADENPRVGYRAVFALAKTPDRSVLTLGRRLRPAPEATPTRVRDLLADLDDPDVAVREKATAVLEALGEAAEPALRKVVGGSPSPEVRARAERLLAKVAWPVPREPQLQSLRALAALEEIATPEARRLLETLATGAPEARLTQEAKAALDRLARRAAKP
jgi:WD40 repeat protein